MAACHYWNQKPSALGLCKPEDDLAVMTGYYLASRTIEAYDNYIMTLKVK